MRLRTYSTIDKFQLGFKVRPRLLQASPSSQRGHVEYQHYHKHIASRAIMAGVLNILCHHGWYIAPMLTRLA